MELNIGLLRKVVEHIEAEPDTFIMETWWTDNSHEDVDTEWFAKVHGRQLGSCGTAGCIAGWTVQLGGGDARTVQLGGGDANCFSRAAEMFLGIDHTTAFQLFTPGETNTVSGYTISDLDDDPTLVRDHVEKTLGVTL